MLKLKAHTCNCFTCRVNRETEERRVIDLQEELAGYADIEIIAALLRNFDSIKDFGEFVDKLVEIKEALNGK